MPTHYGLNPSFLYSSPIPMMTNLVQRARRFEVFTEEGRPTGLVSPILENGCPVADGRYHGVRLAEFEIDLAQLSASVGITLQRTPGGITTAHARSWFPWMAVWLKSQASPGPFRRPSLGALKALRPSVFRTLDWQMTNKRPDWRLPRVRPDDMIQGSDRGMAAELQAQAANLLGAALWWCAPPRFDLDAETYEIRLEEMLVAIRETAKFPPILEYGNELWNAGFAVHRWLSDSDSMRWQDRAALEIATLRRVAARVFGDVGPLGARPYYLFVGGQLTVPSHLSQILEGLSDLGVTPDAAGPALYVTPMKAHKEEWEATGAVPTQDELRSSCLARLSEISNRRRRNADLSISGAFGPLQIHEEMIAGHGIPYFACYEAGQSLIAGSYPWRRSAIEAQKTEWMGELYRGIRNAAEAAGVDLLNWYSAATDQNPADSRVDVFGLLDGVGGQMLPKALAARGD